MEAQYDYTDFINEILDDINDGILQGDDELQILRQDTPIEGGYYPVLDLYYNDDIMMELYNVGEDDEDFDTIMEEKELYLQDKPSLQIYKVADILKEMQDMNKA